MPTTELFAVSRAPKGSPCRVTQIIENLDEPYRSAARDLANLRPHQGGVSDMRAAAQFAEAGIRLSSSMINRHRNRWCLCPSESEKAIV